MALCLAPGLHSPCVSAVHSPCGLFYSHCSLTSSWQKRTVPPVALAAITEENVAQNQTVLQWREAWLVFFLKRC